MSEPNPYQPPIEGGASLAHGTLPVRATGQLTADDAIQSLRAVGKWKSWPYPLIAAAFLIVNGVLFWPTQNRPLTFATAAIVVLPPLFFLIRPWQLTVRFKKSWRARPEHHHPVLWVFSEEGLFVKTSHSQSLQNWGTFLYAKLTPSQIILAHHGNLTFNFIPVRFFESQEDLAAVRHLLESKLTLRQ